MRYRELLDKLRAGSRIVDTRGDFIPAAGPFLIPDLGGVPPRMLEEYRARFSLVATRGPMGLPAYGLPPVRGGVL
jgi:hypothetical protein